jgi:transcriptional regulator with XRE-family HTH domain
MSTWKDIRDRRLRDEPGLEERLETERLALEVVQRLGETRERLGVSQQTVARRLGVSQPNISRIEGEKDVRLSTVERYVRALGGRLRITAEFDGGDTVILMDAPRPASALGTTVVVSPILVSRDTNVLNAEQLWPKKLRPHSAAGGGEPVEMTPAGMNVLPTEGRLARV